MKCTADPAIYPEAEKTLQRPAAFKVQKEKYVVAYAWYDLAELMFTQGNIARAKECIAEARKFDPKDIDFGSVIVRQLDVLEERLAGADIVKLLRDPLPS